MAKFEDASGVDSSVGIDNKNQSLRMSMAMSLKRLTDAMCSPPAPNTDLATAANDTAAKSLAESKLQTAELVKHTAKWAEAITELGKITKALNDRNILLTAQNAELVKQTAALAKSATISEQVALKQGVTIKL